MDKHVVALELTQEELHRFEDLLLALGASLSERADYQLVQCVIATLDNQRNRG